MADTETSNPNAPDAKNRPRTSIDHATGFAPAGARDDATSTVGNRKATRNESASGTRSPLDRPECDDVDHSGTPSPPEALARAEPPILFPPAADPIEVGAVERDDRDHLPQAPVMPGPSGAERQRDETHTDRPAPADGDLCDEAQAPAEIAPQIFDVESSVSESANRTVVIDIYQSVPGVGKMATEGKALFKGDFRVLDWSAPEMLTRAVVKLMESAWAGVEIQKQNWLQVEARRVRHGVSLLVRGAQAERGTLHQECSALAYFLTKRQVSLLNAEAVSADRRTEIQAIAANALGDLAGKQIQLVVSIAIEDEMPIDFKGTWAQQPKPKPEPDPTTHEMKGKWDGQRLSARMLYVMGEGRSLAIAYDEHEFGEPLEELLRQVASNPDTRVHVTYRAANQGRSSGWVLESIKVLADE